MSEFTKGSKVKIVGGKEGVDAVGEIFWWGDSKYGDGMRAGVKTTGGQTYWVDAEDLEAFEGELPEASNDSPPPSDLNAFSRGDRVNIARGKERRDLLVGRVEVW